ncbi:MAG: hypothetical protein B7Y45_10790 [Sphingomonas sp. 28-66-16]|nr:MAG: hypothetical protein B7Y45_10790 [Sphingomonas sp. 28-66-16]
MPMPTPIEIVILATMLAIGWIAGYLTNRNGRIWQQRFEQERDFYRQYRDQTDALNIEKTARIETLEQIVASLERHQPASTAQATVPGPAMAPIAVEPAATADVADPAPVDTAVEHEDEDEVRIAMIGPGEAPPAVAETPLLALVRDPESDPEPAEPSEAQSTAIGATDEQAETAAPPPTDTTDTTDTTEDTPAMSTIETNAVELSEAAPIEDASLPETIEPAMQADREPDPDPIAATDERVDAPPVDASPAPPWEPEAAAGRTARGGSSLLAIRGMDDTLAGRLGALGVTTPEDIERLSAEDELALESRLGLPAGYIAREQWRLQAALLGSGDEDAHQARFPTAHPVPESVD